MLIVGGGKIYIVKLFSLFCVKFQSINENIDIGKSIHIGMKSLNFDP